jgi:hypothetical protein
VLDERVVERIGEHQVHSRPGDSESQSLRACESAAQDLRARTARVRSLAWNGSCSYPMARAGASARIDKREEEEDHGQRSCSEEGNR